MSFASLFTASRARVALLAAVVSGSGVLSGCATKGDLRDVQTEIRSVAARQDTLMVLLRQQSAMTQDTLRTQSSQLVDMRGNMSQQLRQILQELETIRELSGQNQRTIAAVRDQVDALRRTGGSGAPQPGPVGEEGAGGTRSPEAADQMYTAAVSQFQRGSWTAARLGFERFLAEYPSDELAPRAHYYLADILVQQDQPREAIAAFGRVPELFPTDPKVPDALYRIGLLHLELGDRSAARRYLERVVNSYPDSSVTPLARERLREIGGDRR